MGRAFASAGLPEDFLSRREPMVTKEEIFALMESVGRQAAPGASLLVGTGDGIETFSPPIFAAYCSSDGREFLMRLAHYKSIICPLRFIIEESPETLRVEVRGTEIDDTVPSFWVEAEMAFFLNLIRKATGVYVVPLAVTMEHASRSELDAYFGTAATLGMHNTILFSAADMRLPFTSRNDQMWQYIEPELRRRLSEMQVDDTMGARVCSALVELLPAGKSSIDDVAERLCMGRRTLQRKLSAEDTTFQRLLAHTRFLLARHYLHIEGRSSHDVAFLLGYQDTTSFLRAFSHWTGQTVTAFRQDTARQQAARARQEKRTKP